MNNNEPQNPTPEDYNVQIHTGIDRLIEERIAEALTRERGVIERQKHENDELKKRLARLEIFEVFLEVVPELLTFQIKNPEELLAKARVFAEYCQYPSVEPWKRAVREAQRKGVKGITNSLNLRGIRDPGRIFLLDFLMWAMDFPNIWLATYRKSVRYHTDEPGSGKG